MGLSASQARLLTLTARKGDVEYGISMNALEKMSLARQMTELTREYNSKMNSKHLMYCNGGEYHKLNYRYLMGTTKADAMLNGTTAVRDNLDMVLTDNKGQVVIDDNYANRFKQAGLTVDENGRGTTFDQKTLINVMVKMCGYGGKWLASGFAEQAISFFINGGDVDSQTYSAELVKATAKQKVLTNNFDTNENNPKTASECENYLNNNKAVVNNEVNKVTRDNTARYLKLIKQKFDLYYPIVLAAANNGWTTEYNNEMNNNEDYIADSLISGTFQLALVQDDGGYNPDASLAYFTTAGLVVEKNTTEDREKMKAWYDQERSILTEKENFIDLEQTELSTELETIKTEIESIKTYINDAVTSVFNWGTSA